jgi:hypothetical protein
MIRLLFSSSLRKKSQGKPSAGPPLTKGQFLIEEENTKRTPKMGVKKVKADSLLTEYS